MANIKVKINGISDLTSAIDRIKSQIDEATKLATIQSGTKVQAYAVSAFNTPPAPNTRTGNLQRSIKSDPVVHQGIGRYSITVGPRAVYARIQELGGDIEERRAGWLAVKSGYAKSPGQFIKRNFNYPGSHLDIVTIKPHPYFTPSFLRVRGQMRGMFSTAWGKALKSG